MDNVIISTNETCSANETNPTSAISPANAINFLLYSYFGVTLDDDDSTVDQIIQAAIIRAYKDATNQGAYNALFGKDIPRIGEIKKDSDSARQKSEELIFKRINEFFRLSKWTNYQSWHCTVCEELMKEYEKVGVGNNRFFKYGNAQKWVNMTVKYICIFDALQKIPEFHPQIENNIDKYHVPIDSYMINVIWKETDIDLPMKDGKNGREKEYANPSEYVKPWSKWDECTYKRVQKGIKESSNSSRILDWENEAWIKEARRRNKKKSVEEVFPSKFTPNGKAQE